ncbi:MAG: hypothetical protein HY457_00225 [Parcubacteria group bacterium]|nr:hypothetical protein [Parcubacteria group bacterium]
MHIELYPYEGEGGEKFEAHIRPHVKTEVIIIYLGMLSLFRKLKSISHLPRSALLRAAAELRKKLPLENAFPPDELHLLGLKAMETALDFLSHEDDLKPEEAVQAKPDYMNLVRLVENEESIADALLAAVLLFEITWTKPSKPAQE